MGIKSTLKRIHEDSLYRNSVYLMLSTIVLTGFGFLFWTINVRLFTSEQVGIATTIISMMSLLVSISGLGLGTTLIRFLPSSKNKNHKINTCLTVNFLTSIIVSTIFLTGLKFFSPKLIFIKNNLYLALAFMFIVAFQSLFSLTDSIFTAYRENHFTLIKSTIFSTLKLIFPFLLISLGAFGIFMSWGISTFIAMIIGITILIKKNHYIPKPVIYDGILKKIKTYSLSNYTAGILSIAPSLILPLMITNMLNPETTAYYYVAMMIAGLLFIIPQAISQSLFAEGSTNQKGLQINLKKASKTIALLLVPAIIVIVFFGNYLLLLFGRQYLQGFRLLQMSAISSIFMAIKSIYNTKLNIERRVKKIVFINLVTALLILGMSYLLISYGFGLIGIGLAWIIGQSVICLFAIRLIKSRRNKEK